MTHGKTDMDEAQRIIIDLDPEWETKGEEHGDDVLHIAVATDEQFNLFYATVMNALAHIQMTGDDPPSAG